jgi:mannan endo-1,4-beta-mannosidase
MRSRIRRLAPASPVQLPTLSERRPGSATPAAQGVTNITWALHYNAQNYPGDSRNVPASYYPGDDVVDWVGISAYGSERSNDDRCPTFRSLVEDMLPQLRAATPVKPLFIFEFGITNNNPRCAAGPWVQKALTDLLSGRWPDVRGFAWWYERWNNDGADGSDMLVQNDPAVAAAFQTALTGPTASAVVDAPMFE